MPSPAPLVDSSGEPLYLPPLNGNSLLSETTDQAFSQVFTDLLLLYRRVFEQMVLSGFNRPENGDRAAPPG